MCHQAFTRGVVNTSKRQGRFSGSSTFGYLPTQRAVAFILTTKAFYGLTATGIAPDSNGIPFY